MAEIWKPVPSLKGVMASSEGRVQLPPTTAAMPNGGVRVYNTKPVVGAIAASTKGGKHQRRIIRWKRKGVTLKIHQLVCEAFHGPRPFDGAVVLHLNEDGLDNRAANLGWGTQKENLNAPGFIEYCRGRTGESSPTAKSRKKHQFPVGL